MVSSNDSVGNKNMGVQQIYAYGGYLPGLQYERHFNFEKEGKKCAKAEQ
jgi:hypothetical protein